MRAYHRRQLAVLWVLVVVGIGIITYAPAVSPYLHSDDFVLVNWARLGASANGPLWFDAGIARAWGFLPLVLAILGTIHQIVGATGYLYHVVQLGVHFAVSLLAGLLSYRALAGSASQRAAAGLVGIAVLVWPVYHEAVMWVSAIAYPLAGAVGLLTLIPWSKRLPSPRGYLASLTVFTAAMLSHPLAVAYVPSLFALVVVGVGDRRTRLRRGLSSLFPYVALFIAYMLFSSPLGQGRLNASYMRTNLVPLYSTAIRRLLAEVLWFPNGLLGASSAHCLAARTLRALALPGWAVAGSVYNGT